MKNQQDFARMADTLRHQAEERLKILTLPATEPRSEHETQRLMHELQVHQIELEMQNESLLAALAEVEAGQRFIDLYEFAPVPYFSVAPDSQIRLVNLAGARLLGSERAQLRGQRLGAYVSGDDVPVFNTFLSQILSSGEIATCELNLCPSGQGPVITVRIDAVADLMGRVCNLALTDISERKRLEGQIRRADRYREAILDNIPCLVWLKDEQSRFLAVNTPFAKAFGWPSAESLVGKTDFDTVPAEMANGFRAGDRWVLENGTSKCIAEQIQTEGETRWFETWKSPVTLDGRIIGTAGFSRDVTEIREITERLRESEAFNIAILNSLTAQVVVLDENGLIVAANKAWEAFVAENYGLGLAERELGLHYCSTCGAAVGQPCRMPACGVWHAIDEVLLGRSSSTTLDYRCHLPGHSRWFRMSVHALPKPRRGVVVAHEDITELKRAVDEQKAAKAEAEQANLAKSRFLAAASHDLRQPLFALSLYVGMLKSKLSAADATLANNLSSCVSSLNELLTDLLDISKLDAGVVTPEVRDFPVAEVLDSLISIHAPEALLKGLHLRCFSSQLTVNTDPVLFKRIVGNLIANAIRYTESGGVLVGCRRHQGRMWVEVRDTGIGIPEDKIGEIFEEFRQLGTGERNRGSGLGLAIVAKAAALLGLKIRVTSRLGKGSMFAVELPLGRASRTEARQESKSRQLRIALVDDNEAVLTALRCALEEIGHQVVAAATVAELLDRLGGVAPDVVVSDYRLGGGQTGFDVIAAARDAFGEKLPALLITGDTDPKLMRSMADRGVIVQHKPLEIEALQACINEMTNRRLS
ncbi:MAG TPA: PAS domain-containing protein [Azonexus sp.]|nr:PAS domain-containing protein [Azonexus sp.]